MKRKIILDVETTGFSPLDGDRVVEIACIELLDDKDFGKEFHYYINPQRSIPVESSNIHGITNDSIKDSPIFASIASDLIAFIADSTIIAHNAEFDRSFVNFELQKAINFAGYSKDRWIDTLVLAKQKFPALKNSLDALAKRFDVDLTSRAEFHGALVDIKVLALVYEKLINYDNEDFSLESMFKSTESVKNYTNLEVFDRAWVINKEELELHEEMMLKILKNNS